MGEAAVKGLSNFIKQNFRTIKVKGVNNRLMGRRTLDWVLARLQKNRLSHLTPTGLDELAASLELKTVQFDDGNIYYVHPPTEREVLVDFYSQIEESEDSGSLFVKDAAPMLDDDLFDVYRISDAAILELTGDAVDDLELSPDSVVDFISADLISQALEAERVCIYFDEGVYTIVMPGQEMPERDTYPLHLDRVLPGTEVSLEELSLDQKTKITGLYRDQPGIPAEDM